MNPQQTPEALPLHSARTGLLSLKTTLEENALTQTELYQQTLACLEKLASLEAALSPTNSA